MRARNIKPGVFKNEILGTRDPLLTLLFQGLWCLADREGRLEDRPLRIKAEVFPYRSVDVEPLLAELAKDEFITRYEVDGNKYIQINEFLKHQKPHNTERKSVIPAYVNPPLTNGESRPDSLIHRFSDSPIPETPCPPPPPPKTSDLSASEAACLLCDVFHWNLVGERIRRTVRDVVENACAKWKLAPQAAMERLEAAWEQYRKAPGEYKQGIQKWLETGTWAQGKSPTARPLDMLEKRKLRDMGFENLREKSAGEWRVILEQASGDENTIRADAASRS